MKFDDEYKGYRTIVNPGQNAALISQPGSNLVNHVLRVEGPFNRAAVIAAARAWIEADIKAAKKTT